MKIEVSNTPGDHIEMVAQGNEKTDITNDTVTAYFPGIGKVQISRQRAEQIKRLQKIIRERNESEKQG